MERRKLAALIVGGVLLVVVVGAVAFTLSGGGSNGAAKLLDLICSRNSDVVVYEQVPLPDPGTRVDVDRPGRGVVATIEPSACRSIVILGRAPPTPELEKNQGSFISPWWFRISSALETGPVSGWILVGFETAYGTSEWRAPLLTLPVAPIEPIAKEGLPDLFFTGRQRAAQVGDPCFAPGFSVEVGWDTLLSNQGTAAGPPIMDVHDGEVVRNLVLWRGLEPRETLTMRSFASRATVVIDPAGDIVEQNEDNNVVTMPEGVTLYCR